MRALPRNFLSKPGGKWRTVRLLDFVTLLDNIYRAAEDGEIGFEDAGDTIDTLTRKLNKKVLIDPGTLEGALWSCNLMDEKGKFWHPRYKTFDEWVKQLLGQDHFNKIYNLIEKKDGTP